jgi:hypothetical protein
MYARFHSTDAFAPILKFHSDSVFAASVTGQNLCVCVCHMSLNLVSVCSVLHHMLTTCSAMPDDHGAQFGTTRRLCCTTGLSQILCGRARSTMLCTSATAHSVARLVPPVVTRSPSSRPRRPTRPSSASSGALSLPRCMKCSIASWANRHSAASWSVIHLTLQGTVSTTLLHATSPR